MEICAFSRNGLDAGTKAFYRLAKADIATKITKLDAQIVKLKKRIAEDTDKCEQLCQEKALLFYELFCKQYRCEGQELADMLALEHERAALLGTDANAVADNGSADAVNADDNDTELYEDDVDNNDSDDDAQIGQTSFFDENKNSYAV